MDSPAVAYTIMFAVVVAYFLLAFVPGWIASARRCDSAKHIRLLGVVGLFVPPCWFIAMYWAFRGTRLKRS